LSNRDEKEILKNFWERVIFAVGENFFCISDIQVEKMEFIRQSSSGYEILPEAAHFLKQIQTPVGVIVVSGQARQGKSTLLNKLLNCRVFTTSPTTTSQTKGLWIAELIPGILLMDAEGLGDPAAQDQHDFHIFSLCVLLGSILIYNNQGPIHKNSLETLKVAGKLAEWMKTITQVQLSGTQLIWLARDFSLDTVDQNGKACTPNQYLEANITPCLSELFPQRSCFTLPCPNTTQGSYNNNPDFLQGIACLKQYLLHHVQPKQCNGVSLTGVTLLTLATCMIQYINSGQNSINLVPVWEASVQIREQEARQKALSALTLDSQIQEGEVDLLCKCVKIYHSHSIEPKILFLLDLLNEYKKRQDIQLETWLLDCKLERAPSSIKRYLQPLLQKETSHLQHVNETIKEEVQALKLQWEQERLSAELHSNQVDSNFKQQLLELENRVQFYSQQATDANKLYTDLLVQYAGLEANYQEEQLEVEQLRQMVSDQTTAQLQATKKWQSLEEELSRSVKNEEHLRGTVQDRINDTRSMMTRQRLSMETNQLQLTEAQHQITRLTTERRELEGKFSKDVQSISDSLGKCRQEKTDLQTLLDVARSELLKATTELTIVKTREEHRKRPRDEPVEQLKAKVQFLEAQHDSDTKDLRRAREDIANYMRKLVEYEVSNIK
jgi:hypothetical protein